jgi:hypothetical protein
MIDKTYLLNTCARIFEQADQPLTKEQVRERLISFHPDIDQKTADQGINLCISYQRAVEFKSGDIYLYGIQRIINTATAKKWDGPKVSREDFETWTPSHKQEFMRSGGIIA